MPDSAPSFRPDVLLAQASWVRGLARALVLDANHVDDVVQKTWLAALEHPRAEVGNVRAWLAGIVRNIVRQERRSESRRTARELEPRGTEPLPPVAELVERADLQKRVVQAVIELDEPHRSTLLLRYFEDLSAEEIARRLGAPASTVRSRLHAALEMLRARFDRERDGDRRAWSLGLIPLMLPRGSAGAALVPSASTGVSAMIVHASLVTALVVGLGLGASYAYRHIAEPATLEPTVVVAAPSTGAAAAHGASTTQPVVAGSARSEQASQRQPVVPPKELVPVQGRVLDRAGAPVAGATVFVGGRPNPFGTAEAGMRFERSESGADVEIELQQLHEWRAMDTEKLEAHGGVLGKLFTTDATGRFDASVPAGTRVYVTLPARVGLRKAVNGAWHDAPATALELRAERIPTAELVITVIDESSGKPLAFAAELHVANELVAEMEAEGVVRRTVEVTPESGDFRLDIVAPSWARTTRELHPMPGVENAVEVRVQSGAGMAGDVVDALGRPVEGALVWGGELLELREDGSPFRGYEPDRLIGGVRTDARGRFTLPGTPAHISAWHPGHSPASVTAGDAAHLVLGARGAIRGVMLDAHGAPAAGKKIVLDRARAAETDASGAFVFEGVEAGVHGVDYARERFVGVVVAPGQTFDVPNTELVRPRGSVTSGGVPFPGETGGVLVGLDPVFCVSEWGLQAGRFEAGPVCEGKHLLMGGSGVLAVIDVRADSTADIELGTARVTIAGALPGDPLVYLLPEGASLHAAARFWAQRFSEKHASPVYAQLSAGRYVVVVAGREAPLTVDVAEGQELVIPRERWIARPSPR